MFQHFEILFLFSGMKNEGEAKNYYTMEKQDVFLTGTSKAQG